MLQNTGVIEFTSNVGMRQARASRKRYPFLLRLALTALMVLAACGEPNPSYYPLAPGKWWLYEVDTLIRGEPGRHRLLVENLRRDGPALLQRRQGRLLSRLTSDAKGILLTHPANSPRADQLIVPMSPRVGQEWPVTSELALVESRTFAAEDKLQGRHLPLTLTARVVGRTGVVKTAAGTFNGCLEVKLTGKRSVRIDRGNAYAEVSVTQQEWYAPRIGLVKVLRVEAANTTFLRDGRYAQDLREYGE